MEKDAGGAQADWQLFVHDGSGSADSFVLFPSLFPVDGARALHQLDPISAATDFTSHSSRLLMRSRKPTMDAKSYISAGPTPSIQCAHLIVSSARKPTCVLPSCRTVSEFFGLERNPDPDLGVERCRTLTGEMKEFVQVHYFGETPCLSASSVLIRSQSSIRLIRSIRSLYSNLAITYGKSLRVHSDDLKPIVLTALISGGLWLLSKPMLWTKPLQFPGVDKQKALAKPYPGSNAGNNRCYIRM